MEVLLIIGFVLIVLIGRYLRSPSVVGARGERRVNSKLDWKLPSREYTVFHDITLQSNQGPTQIDHIVLSPYGVFVIETKNYSGWIFGDAKSRQWTQVIYREKNRFMNPLRQNYKHVKAVQSFFSLRPKYIHSVVAFVGNSKFKTDLPVNVTTLRGLPRYILSKREVLIGPSRLASMIDQLAAFKEGRRVEPPPLKVVSNDPSCPKCGMTMVKRTARRGSNAGNKFWGCPSFPNCRGNRQI